MTTGYTFANGPFLIEPHLAIYKRSNMEEDVIFYHTNAVRMKLASRTNLSNILEFWSHFIGRCSHFSMIFSWNVSWNISFDISHSVSDDFVSDSSLILSLGKWFFFCFLNGIKQVFRRFIIEFNETVSQKPGHTWSGPLWRIIVFISVPQDLAHFFLWNTMNFIVIYFVDVVFSNHFMMKFWITKIAHNRRSASKQLNMLLSCSRTSRIMGMFTEMTR